MMHGPQIDRSIHEALHGVSGRRCRIIAGVLRDTTVDD